jgi:hypothetical protein
MPNASLGSMRPVHEPLSTQQQQQGADEHARRESTRLGQAGLLCKDHGGDGDL